MVWICLELCGYSSLQIDTQLQQIKHNSDALSAVAFEMYGLGANSTLTYNNVTIVSPQIISYGLEAWAQLSSYPYPPQFLDWMREVFINPQPFINQCLEQAKKYNYTGYNLDWEPTAAATEKDAADYAKFITTFADQLHANQYRLSVDFASWNTIWNFTDLSQTSADVLIDMSTYTSSNETFLIELAEAINTIGVDKLGVGLETVDGYGSFISESEISYRFDVIKNQGCNEIDVWDEPLPPFWWPLLRSFKQHQ